MPIVRTKMQPDVDLDVSEQEAEVLRHQGLLVEGEPAVEGEKSPAPSPSAVKTPPSSPATTSKES